MTTLLLLALGSGSAIAQPGNDTISGATPAYAGFNETLDTTEATTDADDQQLNEPCGFPSTDASVWYAYVASSNATVIVDVSQSDYFAGILVGVGTPGSLDMETCAFDTVAFRATAGEIYYILAFDPQYDGGGNGGELSINFSEAPTPVIEDFTVNRFGLFDPRTGVATVSGSYTCSGGTDLSVYVDVAQPVGRLTVSGFGAFYDHDTCDQQPRPWTTEVTSLNGRFGGGKAATVSYSYACGQFFCTFHGYVEQKVQLRGERRK